MANAFTNFLGNVAKGFLDGAADSGADLRDYQHADRLYVKNTFERSPKVGFLYFVSFNLSKGVVDKIDPSYAQRGVNDVGLLVKRVELPKFKIATETLNQYNRKTVVQTKISYEPINIDFHDDNNDVTTKLWKTYYNFYYMDGIYGQVKDNIVPQYKDTKYGISDYAFGLDSYQEEFNLPFFTSIDIYALHQKKFSQYTLINPKIISWDHDSLSQEENSRVLANKMNIAYEAVVYKSGKIKKFNSSGKFTAVYYDNTKSPLRTGAGLLDSISDAGDIFGEDGTLANAKSPLDYLRVGLETRDLYNNVRKLNKAGLKQEGYSIVSGVLNNISSQGNQPTELRNNINQGLNIVTSAVQEQLTKAQSWSPIKK
jgi:hypothetical protein